MQPLGIIPARGGSKGVPRKNIRLIAGKPLLTYAIDAARRSRRLMHFAVSTDDPEIAAVAEAAHAEARMRPPRLARDDTPALPVVTHLLEELDPTGTRFDSVVYMQPTSPLRTAEDIDAAVGLLEESGADSVVSVYQVDDHHPARMYRLIDGRLIPFTQEPCDRLRQKLPAVYHRNGAIYACRRCVIEDQQTMIGEDVRPYLMPYERSVNIDNEVDLLLADMLVQRGTGNYREVA